MSGSLFVVSAPSGAGKTSLIHAVLTDLKSSHEIQRVVTYTTKKPRAGEVDGKDYHFISKELFEKLAKEGFFLEYSTDYAAYYGTPADISLKLAQGISLVLIIDRRGARQIVAKMPEAVLIWIDAPGLQELERRLRGRGTETESQISYRLEQAKIEIEQESRESLYPYHILNDNFLSAAQHLKRLIIDQIAKGN